MYKKNIKSNKTPCTSIYVKNPNQSLFEKTKTIYYHSITKCTINMDRLDFRFFQGKLKNQQRALCISPYIFFRHLLHHYNSFRGCTLASDNTRYNCNHHRRNHQTISKNLRA